MARFSYSKAYSSWGASMGRRSDPIAFFDLTKPLKLQRVPACDSGGDYDPGGAYWGDLRGNPLWRCEDHEGSVIYLRARNREEAKASIQRECGEKARFYK
jgi:hypothetical protein